MHSSLNGITEAPGKVWFFELAAAVIDADRCVQCGACVAACPTDSIGVNADDLPYLVKMCTGCSLCWDFCPRGGLRYEATWPEAAALAAERVAEKDRPTAAPVPITAAVDGDGLPAVITGIDPTPGLGVVIGSYAARVHADSKYRAAGSQDGGVVTAVLIAALEQGAIDGALVSRVDRTTPWRGVPFVATTRDQILEAGGSFYNQTMALAALDLTRVGLDENAKIAVVGTPCEIQGIRALQAREWYRGVSQVDAIVLTIALMCTKNFDYKRLMLGAFADERGLDLNEIGKVDVIHGRMLAWDRSGAVLVDEPVKSFHSAALKGCDECADFLGRSADISVGSVGSMNGWTSVIIRTERGRLAFQAARAKLDVRGLDDPAALLRLDALDKKIAGRTLQRKLDPDAPLFIDFDEHVRTYEGSDRQPVYIRH